MPLLHHVSTGAGAPPIVFVHGFACDHTDWNAQVTQLSGRHRCLAVDLRGHGDSPGDAADCSVERNGADVAAVMRAHSLPPAVLVGHSMGCRVVVEAALQAPEHVSGIVLVDGSQFTPAMRAALAESFKTPDGFANATGPGFQQMFTAKSDPAIAAAVVARAGRLARPVGEKLLTDLARYDTTRLPRSLGDLRVPLLAIQTTTRDENQGRQPMRVGDTSAYLDLLRAQVPDVRIAIIPETGHFPQIDEAGRTNAAIEEFLTGL